MSSCMQQGKLSPSDVQELTIKHFQEKGFLEFQDTSHVGVKLIKTGLEDQWYVAFNRIMNEPILFLYHVNEPHNPPHYIPIHSKSHCIIEDVDFENITNDDLNELVVELHYDYDMAYQGREIVILRDPFGDAVYEIFSFPFEQVWESIDSFDVTYGMPSHSKRIENHASYEFFEGYVLIKGVINYRKNHLIKYKWDHTSKVFILVLDEELHEAEDEENLGGFTHKIKGNKVLIEVNAHEEHCTAYLLEDEQGHVIDIDKKIHDALLCSKVTALSDNGRYLIYTNIKKNAIFLYDLELRKERRLLAHYNSYEGISEITWAPKSSSRFAFISVNQEEVLENTLLHVFTIDKQGEVFEQTQPIKVHYDCDLEGYCAPLKDYHYKFDRYRRFVYTPLDNGVFKAIILQ